MSYTLHQVSNEGKVIVFCQNQKAPNKVGETLCHKVEELLKAGHSFKQVKDAITEQHSIYQKEKIRGIDSVNLSVREDLDSSLQPSRSLYLSYKLNGTFCTLTEYEPLKK